MLQLQNQSLRAQKESHSQVQHWNVGGGELVSQFLLLIVWICKKKLKSGSPYVFTKFFRKKTSQIAAEIVGNSIDLLSTHHMAIRHLEFRTFAIFRFCAFNMRSKQKKKKRQNSNFSLKLKHLEKACWFLKGNCATVEVNERQTEIWLSFCLKIQYSQ